MVKLYKLAFAVLLVLQAGAWAQNFAAVPPEEVGLSAQRLERIRPAMQEYIDDGKLAGMITLVVKHGQIVHFETYGMADISAKKKMAKDDIFRIYSMSKPITSAAVMMLYEEGKLLLTDPVKKHIPEFENLKVFVGGTSETPELAELERDVTVQDLLRHTAGLTYTWGSTAVDSLYRSREIFGEGDTLHDMVVKLGDIPLLYQPGEKWHYSVAVDVQGYLVQVISGMPFEEYLAKKIFEPLGMKDTGFYVPKGKLDRFTTRYDQTEEQGVAVGDHPDSSNYREPPTLASGGGGLVSTIDDYLRFAQMILNGGELNGVRILGRQTVEFMLEDHLPQGVEVGPGVGMGLGFGIETDRAKSGVLCSPGEASWSGAANTFFWIDPEEDMIYMVWTQLFPWGIYDYRHQFRTLVHAAIID